MINFNKFIKKIRNKKAKVGVIGMGYVGLPLSILISKKSFKVFGFDEDIIKINKLKNGISYINHLPKIQLSKSIKNKNLIPTNNFNLLSKMDIIIICVPTPLNKAKKPNLKFVKSITKKIVKNIKNSSPLIILESTTYPGTSNELLNEYFKKNSLVDGKNFYMSYSPEREDPGNKKYSILKGNLPKVVSGYSNSCLNLVKILYKFVTNKTSTVTSIKTAEFTKLLENIYRSVNIGLVNELSEICRKLDIDIYESIRAAKTKPFGYTPFYPGPGVGGHCIPTDPYFLSWKAKEHGLATKFIKLAGDINDSKPLKISKKIEKLLNKLNYNFEKKILVLGITYKKNSDDTRDSPAIRICKSFNKKIRNKILVCDPLVSDFFKKDLPFKFIQMNDLKKKKKMPMILWAYPREYKDQASAAQNTSNPNKFTYPYYGSPIYWVTRGYVVVDQASFPIVGTGDNEPNDSFIKQLVSNAQAAVDAVNNLGYIDTARIAVGGHSYGAFMVANLLSHSNLFSAGIARSGAYNRTLTPFGFQSEQRSYWEAPNVYYNMSPFMHADKMKTPLLLIHGEADNNSGTYPMQSKRYFNALKGLGAVTRLVILPNESHGYRARESILHLLWEQDQWLDKYVKNK